VAPLYLGETGCTVMAGGAKHTVTAGVPGDVLRFMPGQDGPGRVQRVVRPSPDRVDAPCALLDRCGGCTFGAMAYPAQLEARHRALVKALASICPPDRIAPIQGLKQPFGYRTRLLMNASPIAGTKRGFSLGFFGQGTTDLVQASGCPVQHPLTLATLAMVRQTLEASPITATAAGPPDGWLHGLGVRVDPSTGTSEVTLVGRTPKLPGGQGLARQLAALPGVGSLHLNVNPERSSYLYGESFVHLGGMKRIAFHVCGERFLLSPGAFFQSSMEGAELLVDTVRTLMPPSVSTLADLYGGVGLFARLTASRWRRALVAEANPHAIDDLRNWLHHVGAPTLRAVPGRVEDTLSEVIGQRPDLVILDPPRAGCNPRVIAGLIASRTPTILYVACGIQALQRDGAALTAAGYHVEQVASVDMFPHTGHLEVVAKFVAPKV